MKIILSILSVLLLTCTTPETKTPTDILSEKVFIAILKEVHLAEAKFEIHKTKGIENAKNELAHNYNTVYEALEITVDDFDKTLEYYAQYPEQLEKIYASVLKQLIQERSNLDRLETN